MYNILWGLRSLKLKRERGKREGVVGFLSLSYEGGVGVGWFGWP